MASRGAFTSTERIPRQVGGAEFTSLYYGSSFRPMKRHDPNNVFGSCLPRFETKTSRHIAQPKTTPTIPPQRVHRPRPGDPPSDGRCVPAAGVGDYDIRPEAPLLRTSTSLSRKGYGNFVSKEDRFSTNQAFIGSVLSHTRGLPGPGSYNPSLPQHGSPARNSTDFRIPASAVAFSSSTYTEPPPFHHLTPGPGAYAHNSPRRPHYRRVDHISSHRTASPPPTQSASASPRPTEHKQSLSAVARALRPPLQENVAGFNATAPRFRTQRQEQMGVHHEETMPIPSSVVSAGGARSVFRSSTTRQPFPTHNAAMPGPASYNNEEGDFPRVKPVAQYIKQGLPLGEALQTAQKDAFVSNARNHGSLSKNPYIPSAVFQKSVPPLHPPIDDIPGPGSYL